MISLLVSMRIHLMIFMLMLLVTQMRLTFVKKFTYLLNLISANLTESKCGVIAFMVGYCTVAESVVLN